MQVFNGDVKLVIFRMKKVEVDGQLGFLITIEEAPKSRYGNIGLHMHLIYIPNPPSNPHLASPRYVTDRPELPFRVLNRFRARPDRGPAQAATADHLGMAAPAAAAVASARPPFPGLAVVAPCEELPLDGGAATVGSGAAAIDPARCLEIFGITYYGETDGDGGGGSSSSAAGISCISTSNSHCRSISHVGIEAGALISSLPLPEHVYEDKEKAASDEVDTPLWDPDWEMDFEDWECNLVEG